MKYYTVFVFDVGGTLVRLDMDRLVRAYLDACESQGIALDPGHTRTVVEQLEMELPQRQQQRLVSLETGHGAGFWDEFYLEGFRRLGIRQDMSAAAANIRERFQRAEFEALFDDAVPALEALSVRGVKMGILSNFSPNCEDVLHQLGIHRHFSFFVVSALAGVEKPDPRIFELVVRAAERPQADIVYVGDSIFHDIDGARRAGLDGILVDRLDRYPNFDGARVRDLRQLVEYVDPGTFEPNASKR